jgi:hypothetical protein
MQLQFRLFLERCAVLPCEPVVSRPLAVYRDGDVMLRDLGLTSTGSQGMPISQAPALWPREGWRATLRRFVGLLDVIRVDQLVGYMARRSAVRHGAHARIAHSTTRSTAGTAGSRAPTNDVGGHRAGGRTKHANLGYAASIPGRVRRWGAGLLYAIRLHAVHGPLCSSASSR